MRFSFLDGQRAGRVAMQSIHLFANNLPDPSDLNADGIADQLSELSMATGSVDWDGLVNELGGLSVWNDSHSVIKEAFVYVFFYILSAIYPCTDKDLERSARSKAKTDNRVYIERVDPLHLSKYQNVRNIC
jgi:hypothetical protein